jgi:membrane-bound transcription factor site-1 protease
MREQSDVLDWHGDHPFTNFHDALNALRVAGYYVEVMHSPATCFDARNYGAYLVVDPEEEWYP